MQGTRKEKAKNRVVRIPVEKLLEEDEWLSITNVNCYSEYEYSQFVKIVTRELFFYITKILDIKVGFPKIITAVNKEVVGRWECTMYNHLWWVPFIKKEYTWRWWYTKLDFIQSKLFIVSKFDYRFRKLFSIVLHEIVHGYMMDRSISDLSMHGPVYQYYLWKFNKIMKNNSLPTATSRGTYIDNEIIRYR